MKQEIKDRWVTALRSGEYEQTDGYLHTEAGWCCLGVLCDIVREDVAGTWVEVENGIWQFILDAGENGISLPPDLVAEFADLNDSNPQVWFGGGRISLAELNDGGHTFAEIAVVIEEKL